MPSLMPDLGRITEALAIAGAALAALTVRWTAVVQVIDRQADRTTRKSKLRVVPPSS